MNRESRLRVAAILQRAWWKCIRWAARASSGGSPASLIYITLAMDAHTWAMLWLFRAATHMRPVSVP